MTKFKTTMIVAVSLATGMLGGAAVTAYAAQMNMQAAIDHLVTADAYLVRASDNKGGHKVKARALISAAINEVRLGIRAGAN